MNERNSARAGTLVAGALAADGLLHAYWATGYFLARRLGIAKEGSADVG